VSNLGLVPRSQRVATGSAGTFNRRCQYYGIRAWHQRWSSGPSSGWNAGKGMSGRRDVGPPLRRGTRGWGYAPGIGSGPACSTAFNVNNQFNFFLADDRIRAPAEERAGL
jgi:hypothetical protein